jgi:hypothetical protein
MMDQDTYNQQLIELIREALDNSSGTVDGAADYLLNRKKPFFLTRNYKEKREALYRAKKVFHTTRDRPLWFVLSCLGLKMEDIEAEG